jgi:hypothetical protein
MTTEAVELWELWAPPLNPPVDGGLPAQFAQQIAEQHAACNPHLIAALLWEAYAGTLQPQASVQRVATGVQEVWYSAPGDPVSAAMARAAWHRSFLTDMVSVPLKVTHPNWHRWPVDWWQRNFEDWPWW